MTINRQLISALSALFLAALIGIQLIALKSAQRHFQQQLESVAQDAATSLGLALGVLLRDRDVALAETVINPAFDRGQYARIEFVSGAGEVIVSRALQVARPGEVPGWFERAVPLHGPSAESLVTAGWRQLGRVRVTVHPRAAYEQLWASARSTTLYMIAIYAVGLVFLRLILAGVLRPLGRIERAAQAIAERSFVTIDERPATRELARVVDAMNALSRRVREAFEAEIRRADALQREALHDAVTGLLNRRGLVEQFESAWGRGGETFAGSLCVVEVPGLAGINAQLGADACDTLLRALAGRVAAAAGDAKGLCARWAGAQFVLVIPGREDAPAAHWLPRWREDLQLMLREAGVRSESRLRAAVVDAPDGGRLESLMEAVQSLIERARLAPDAAVPSIRLARGAPATGSAFAAVRDALDAKRLLLVGQPVLSLDGGHRLHTEIMARIARPDGGTIPAADFLWIAARNGWLQRLDEIVVEQVCMALAGRREPGSVAVNLSPRSIDAPGFVERLVSTLEAHRVPRGTLVFELSEHGVARDEGAALRLAQSLRRAGAGFAIDHFGLHRSSLALMARLRPDYLKLAPGHTTRVADDAGARFLVESLARAARHFDIPLIAQNVETEPLLAALRELGVTGVQGHLAGMPADWPGGAA